MHAAPRRPRYVAAVLAAQRVKPRDELPMLLEHLTVVTRDEFSDSQYIPRELWSTHLLSWALPRVADGGGGEAMVEAPLYHACEMLRALLEAMAATRADADADDASAGADADADAALAEPPLPPLLCPLLTSLVTSEEAKKVILPDDDARRLLGERLPVVPVVAEPSHEPARKLRICYHQHAWRAGARWGVDELRRSCNVTPEAPLSLAEVRELGVDVTSYQQLVELAPAHAVPLRLQCPRGRPCVCAQAERGSSRRCSGRAVQRRPPGHVPQGHRRVAAPQALRLSTLQASRGRPRTLGRRSAPSTR